jgi:hypothetical protein
MSLILKIGDFTYLWDTKLLKYNQLFNIYDINGCTIPRIISYIDHKINLISNVRMYHMNDIYIYKFINKDGIHYDYDNIEFELLLKQIERLNNYINVAYETNIINIDDYLEIENIENSSLINESNIDYIFNKMKL